MRKYWLLVIIAAVFEVMWVVGLKHAVTWVEWGLTALAIVISFGGLILSGKHLPTCTVYAIFVGLGTAGTVIIEAAWFNVPLSWEKVGLIALLLAGVIGLKLITSSEDQQKQEELN